MEQSIPLQLKGDGSPICLVGTEARMAAKTLLLAATGFDLSNEIQ